MDRGTTLRVVLRRDGLFDEELLEESERPRPLPSPSLLKATGGVPVKFHLLPSSQGVIPTLPPSSKRSSLRTEAGRKGRRFNSVIVISDEEGRRFSPNTSSFNLSEKNR